VSDPIENTVGYAVSGGRITANNELIRTRKEAVMACFKVLAQHLFGGTEKDHKLSVKISDLWAEGKSLPNIKQMC
jgi:hypothetical protein